MNCDRCGATWEVAPDFEYPDECPYCGSLLVDGAGILKHVIDKYSNEILLDPKKLKNILVDYLDGKAPEMVAISVAIEEGIGEYFYRATNAKGKTRDKYIDRAYYLLHDELGYTNSRTQLILRSFLHALQIKPIITHQNYCDRDAIYYHLAIKYYAMNNSIAENVLRVSADTGNRQALGEYVHRVRDHWRNITDPNTWYSWNMSLNYKGSTYRTEVWHDLLFARIYGVGTCEQNSECLMPLCMRLIKAGDSEAMLESLIRSFIDKNYRKIYNGSLETVLDRIGDMAERQFMFAPTVNKYLIDMNITVEYVLKLRASKYNTQFDEWNEMLSKKNISKICYLVAQYFKHSKKDECYQYWLLRYMKMLNSGETQ